MKKIQAVGECIYCGSRVDLSDEHIIPRGLNGTHVLRKASCRACARITAAVEQKVLRGFMHGARTVASMKTRRPKERPPTVALKVLRSGVWTTHELPPDQHPGFLFLPRLAPARYLHGGKVCPGVTVSGWECLYFGERPEAVGASFGVSEIQVSHEWDVTAFARMLAKIALGFAVAQYGVAAIRPSDLSAIILGQSDDISEFVGSDQFPPAKSPANLLHSAVPHILKHKDGRHAVVFQIKLFAGSGTSGYEVLVRTWPQRVRPMREPC